MTMSNSCNVLRETPSGELIVAADFAATGRPAATFHDLVERLQADHTIWETAPVPYGQEPGMTGRDQTQRWARDIRDSGLRVRALLGFCGGGVYAAALAEQIAGWQERPRLILLDPGFARRHMLIEHVEGLLRRLGSTLSPIQLDDAKRRLEKVDASTEDPLDLAAALSELCREVITPAVIRAGHSPQASAEFTDLVVGYLHWLAGAAQLDPRTTWSGATALNSRTPGVGLHLIPPEERAGLVAQATFCEVDHVDMLRSPEIARAVDELLS